ncbi:MAG: metal-dependent transcriptional regulator [Methanomicrobiaceae archaeon]|uniref:Putative zinc-dependent repressor zntr, dtxr superfamily n=1 Tax=hydrocarbon metagenome TaxID=938273 RepID=A0A0W8FJC7_9ZZZZ|nr:metal-dependent transcriptional regulator [Methanomicrobiaceae archaeon]MDD5419896.1 metal-dependent transcriptional regulator [Methanomicrobiaceae archaeon]
MRGVDGLELSAKRAEYLKYIFNQGDVVRTTDISTHFSVAPSTVTKTLEDLARSGFVEHSPYHGVRISRRGREYARFLIRRHRLLALMLSRHGLSPDAACREARSFEWYVNKSVVDSICASLGHPVMSVCGPIEHDTCCCCPADR